MIVFSSNKNPLKTHLLTPRALTRDDPQCVLCVRTIDQSEPAISPNGPMRGSVVSDYQEHNREHVFTRSGPDWLPGSSPFLGQLTCQSSQSSVFMEITCPGHKIQALRQEGVAHLVQ